MQHERRSQHADCVQYPYYRLACCVLLHSLISQSPHYGSTTTATAFTWTARTQRSVFYHTRNSRSIENDNVVRNPIRFQRRADALTSTSISILADGRNEPTITITNNDHNKNNSNNHDHDDDAALTSFVSDLTRLMTIRPPNPLSDFSVPAAIISAGSSYTRLWRATTWEGHQCPPLSRYFKHVRRWNTSSTARKILPAVLLSALYSLAVAFTLRHLPLGQHYLGSLTKGASASMAALTGPLALLLTLRTNASLGRLVEARLLWGRLVLHARSLAGLFASNVYAYNPNAVVLACRYLVRAGWSLKAQVRNEPRETEEEVVHTMLRGANAEEARWLLRQPKRNMAITARLRHLLSSIAVSWPVDSVGEFERARHTMEATISDIESDVGGCERLLTSPIPPTYSRHLSRIMVMYLGLLPFGLVASGIPSLGTALASASISYMLIGIDEIGMEIENPFPLLPLQQLAGVIQTDVATQLLCHQDLPPSSPPLEGNC